MPSNPNEDPGHPEVTGQPWPGDIAEPKPEEDEAEAETKSGADEDALAPSPEDA